ncbi:MAG: CehA/McbA family metallohydrolase [Phycisphaerales bacterium]|nr:CehA/McbA family metallohydrolase [Phycisphaerales bacterium]
MTTLLCIAAIAAPVTLTTSDTPTSTLNVTITTSDGQPLPVRLTFLKGTGEDPGEIFDVVDGDPTRLAIRRNVVYTIDGEAELTVPSGSWQVLASRGMEYGLARCHLDLLPDSTVHWEATIDPAIDTTGWAGGDFHLHTLTHSGHGDSNMPERMISIAGEGVEFAVATDHNHNTDYLPDMKSTGADAWFTTVAGNEISADYGHFNAYPLDPSAEVIDWTAPAPALFAEVRLNTSDFDTVPVVQVNHPRWGDIDYFGARGLNPWTSESSHPEWSWDFDAVEVMNENAGWGWYDAETDEEAVDSCSHSVMRDWINMINAGRRIAPMGNSDSHTVESNFAGIPRTYVRVDDANPTAIDPEDVAAAVRRGAVLATTGPFLTVSADGGGPGDLVSPDGGAFDLTIGVQAAPWIPVDRIRVLADGDELAAFSLAEDGYTPPMLIGPLRVEASQDSWMTVIAESDRSMAPVVRDRRRPIRPLAVTGPIRIDADGDGQWTPPLAAAHVIASQAGGDWAALQGEWSRRGPHGRAMLLRAAVRDPRMAASAIEAGLADEDRLVRATSITAAERIGITPYRADIAAIVVAPTADQALAYTAWAACDRAVPDADLFDTYVARFGMDAARRHQKEHPFRLPGAFIQDWEVTGYFDAPSMDTLASQQAPEPGVVHVTPPRTKDGHPIDWTPVKASETGHLNFADGTAAADHAVVYARATLHSPDARRVAFTVGSDDGCRIWIGEQLVWDDPSWQSASPDAKTFQADLKPGENEILVKLLNGVGGYGLYLRPLDDDLH